MIVAILLSEQEEALDATQFRQHAARAREMAKSGDDIRLSRMLLDVAHELDAEADLMETEAPSARPPMAARTRVPDGDADIVPVEIIDRAIFGKKSRPDGGPELPGGVRASFGEFALQLEVAIGSH